MVLFLLFKQRIPNSIAGLSERRCCPPAQLKTKLEETLPPEATREILQTKQRHCRAPQPRLRGDGESPLVMRQGFDIA